MLATSKVVYNAAVVSGNASKIYIGQTGNTFKDRFNNHKKSFRYIKYEKDTEQSKYVWELKGPYADHILIPQGSTGSSTFFLYQMKAHIFLVANPKFQLQILCSSGDMTKNVKLIGIPENDFLCIFIIASSPGVHTFFCLWRVNKKLPQGETSQIAFQRSRSISQK